MVAVPERMDCTLQCPPHLGPAAGAARTNPGPEGQAGALVKADSPAQHPRGGNPPQRRVKAEPRSEAELGHSCTGPHPCPGLRQPDLTSMPWPRPGHIGQQVCEEQRAPPPPQSSHPGGAPGPCTRSRPTAQAGTPWGPRPVTPVAAVSLGKDPDCPTPSRESQEVPTDPPAASRERTPVHPHRGRWPACPWQRPPGSSLSLNGLPGDTCGWSQGQRRAGCPVDRLGGSEAWRPGVSTRLRQGDLSLVAGPRATPSPPSGPWSPAPQGHPGWPCPPRRPGGGSEAAPPPTRRGTAPALLREGGEAGHRGPGDAGWRAGGAGLVSRRAGRGPCLCCHR